MKKTEYTVIRLQTCVVSYNINDCYLISDEFYVNEQYFFSNRKGFLCFYKIDTVNLKKKYVAVVFSKPITIPSRTKFTNRHRP